ncbi:RNA polymerase sigma factor [Catalinimonas niigatensis]|uniref:RNA polymerase sigma factor n=1 Tax=Catalinimonas niigatensis TaxID=1397264 RepID=UPI00266524DE|nr:sigma-70 family RNA polymerase sigma factor [Catalinimonas niigatensis]WPP51816.1 sigma-70 family RNA polymerase sigma factor [Catalinimonas niigatensis]
MSKADEQTDDYTLWREFRNGSHQAFGIIYSKFFPALYNYGRKFTPQTDLIEECAQQLFVELWQTRQRLSDVSTIRPYLYKSFRRKLLKNITVSSAVAYLDSHLQSFSVEVSREMEIMYAERTDVQSKILNEALKSLSDRQREVIFLKFYDQLSYAEISVIMGCNAKVAYDLVFKAIKKMRTFIPKKEFILFSTVTLAYIISCFIF